jgi:hypothetical protein
MERLERLGRRGTPVMEDEERPLLGSLHHGLERPAIGQSDKVVHELQE